MEVNMAPSVYLLLLAFDPTGVVILKCLFKNKDKKGASQLLCSRVWNVQPFNL